jgi:hypothetical protein
MGSSWNAKGDQMTNQQTTVLSMLLGGSVDRIEAENIGIMNLSAIISRLRKKNFTIKKTTKIRPNALKTRVVEVAEYYLV